MDFVSIYLPEWSTRWRDVKCGKAANALCHWSFPNLQYVLLVPTNISSHKSIHVFKMLQKVQNVAVTSSGARSKTLPAMVNETVGILESCEQSTADSPFGLGMRSHI